MFQVSRIANLYVRISDHSNSTTPASSVRNHRFAFTDPSWIHRRGFGAYRNSWVLIGMNINYRSHSLAWPLINLILASPRLSRNILARLCNASIELSKTLYLIQLCLNARNANASMYIHVFRHQRLALVRIDQEMVCT